MNVSKLIRVHLEDVLNVIKEMYGHETPAMILVGHRFSLFHRSIHNFLQWVSSVYEMKAQHFCLVQGHVNPLFPLSDLISCLSKTLECWNWGSAMASLVHMQYILSDQQLHFPSVEKAIEWSVRGGGALRNVDSAHISVPSTLKYQEDRHCYVWRTHLEHSEAYWRGWYEGLSDVFLSCPVPKLLLLAGTDRLDRNLTIGQMQGKFQMIVVRNTGYAIQEDVPDEFANVMLNFISWNCIGAHGVEIPALQ
ncbi:unnamed protein product [Sphagnum troendelagicum]|uniref:Protein phosphatase methylesterase-1 n=1 Tax=Sphagnum troendelagicum TaxID=128251 RepID=A0ABP0UA35_9BRYO